MTKPKLLHIVISKRDEILAIAKECGVENVRIFGSVASGTENKKSDIDFLVDITKKPDGTKGNYYEFALEVTQLFKKRKVEACILNGMPPRIKKNIEKNYISIMEDNPKFLKKVKKDYLANIEQSLEWIGTYNKFYAKYKYKDIRNSESLLNEYRSIVQKPVEEMVRFVPFEMKKQFAPDINWLKIKELRNLIVHNYRNIGYEGMWELTHKRMVMLEKGTRQLYKFLKEREEGNKNKK